MAIAEIPVLYRVARRLGLDATDAEDLVGAALVSASRAWPKFDGAFPRSWLIRILKNEHLSQIRKKGARPLTIPLDDSEPCDSDLVEQVGTLIAGQQILAELDRLPEEFRLAVALCDVEEMSYEEAAIAMDVPIGTVRSRLFRGRRQLRERLSKAWPDESGPDTNHARLIGAT